MTAASCRRGARHPDLVPRAILQALQSGEESANHMEQIALDMGALWSSQLPELAHRAAELRGLGLVASMRVGGRVLLEEGGLDVAAKAATSSSDTVRGWAVMAVGQVPELGQGARLELVRPFADDGHFAVREWAWLAFRDSVDLDVRKAVDLLLPWTESSSERLRRFASEVTRPRGVWSRHLQAVKRNPEIGRPILEKLKCDPHRYVQDSVSNWLNDASKSYPAWVRALCDGWLDESAEPSTQRICRRGMRSLSKSG